jgi:hypothetical protein
VVLQDLLSPHRILQVIRAHPNRKSHSTAKRWKVKRRDQELNQRETHHERPPTPGRPDMYVCVCVWINVRREVVRVGVGESSSGCDKFGVRQTSGAKAPQNFAFFLKFLCDCARLFSIFNQTAAVVGQKLCTESNLKWDCHKLLYTPRHTKTIKKIIKCEDSLRRRKQLTRPPANDLMELALREVCATSQSYA